MSKEKKYDLEERLVDFTVLVFAVVKSLTKDYVGTHLGNQIVRSGTSPALNYGEAQAAESRRDFIHKMTISLKELRETLLNLKIIKRNKFSNNVEALEACLKETIELISIFVKSIETAKRNGK